MENTQNNAPFIYLKDGILSAALTLFRAGCAGILFCLNSYHSKHVKDWIDDIEHYILDLVDLEKKRVLAPSEVFKDDKEG